VTETPARRGFSLAIAHGTSGCRTTAVTVVPDGRKTIAVIAAPFLPRMTVDRRRILAAAVVRHATLDGT
jgi:hypothetical protein